MKLIWIYLLLVISSFSYGEEIISVSYVISIIENQANNEEHSIEFYSYEPSESGINAIVWLNGEEDFYNNQEEIRIPHDLLDIPILNENTDINTMKEFYENEQNNYDIAGLLGGGGGALIVDQGSLENNTFLDEDIKSAIVSTFGGGGGLSTQEILKQNTNDFSAEDITNDIVSSFGGGGGYKGLLFKNLSEDEINNLFNQLNGDQNTQDNFFKYDPSKDRKNKRTNFPQEIVGTLGGGGVALASQYSPGKYEDNFSNVFILVRRKNLQEHFDAGYFPQSSFSLTGSDPISRGFIDSNGAFPAQLNMIGIRFQ